MAHLKAVIFDLDGTLVDSVSDLRAALNRVLADHGRRAVNDDEVTLMVGDGAAKLVERGFEVTGEPLPQADVASVTETYLKIYDGEGAVMTKPFPGVIETLTTLKADGLKLAVCTNKPQGPSENILREFDMDQFFDAVVGGDALPVRKPDAGHVNGVLKMLGVGKEEAIFVGDSPNDVAAAKNADLPVVAVSYGYTRIPPKDLGANVLIDNFDQLPGALKELG